MRGVDLRGVSTSGRVWSISATFCVEHTITSRTQPLTASSRLKQSTGLTAPAYGHGSSCATAMPASAADATAVSRARPS